MADLGRLGWYLRRLARMSAPELLHRVAEQVRRRQDRARGWGWSAFGAWEGQVAGLPGLAPQGIAGLADRARPAAAAALEGRLRLLNQDWPEPGESKWWRTDIWRLDPVTRLVWPGPDQFAFDAPYRHDPDRGDVKFVWELNRLQFLPALALAGHADAAWQVLEGWMAANPPYRGINWVGGIEAASRLASVLALQSIAPATPERQAGLRGFVEAHARWIDRYPSRFSSANNHRVSELAGLFLAATCAPGLPDASRYLHEARQGLEQEVLRQFHADGVGAEQSPTYTAYSLEWFTLAGIAAEAAAAPLSETYRRRLGEAAEGLAWMLDDGGHHPHIGDDDAGRVLALTQETEDDYPRSVAALTLRWLGRPAPDGRRRPELRDGLAVRAEPRPASAQAGARTFAEGGYTIARRPTPRGSAVFLFDHGPLGFLSIAAHGHADALAVWLHWGEDAVFVDAGTYLYHSGGAWRTYFRGTRAHNTLAIEDADQSRMAGAFNWSAHAKARLLAHSQEEIVAEHDGYVGRFGLVHRRRVALEPDAYVVSDHILGRPKQPSLRWSSGLMIGPGVKASMAGERVELATPGGRRLSVETPGARAAIETAHYSDAFNRLQTVERLVISGAVSDRSASGQVAEMRIVLQPD